MKKRALISIYDKSNLSVLLEKLTGYELIATGSSAIAIKELGYEVISVEDVTGFPEILHGRVKTLHPKVFGGILTTTSSEDLATIAANDISKIDVVICNLYPFYDTVMNPTSTKEDIIENIDIGGVSLIRAAAKNFKFCSILIDPEDYATYDPSNNQEYAKKAFMVTARYDQMIFEYFNEDTFNNFNYEHKQALSYGENRHQDAKFLFNKLPFEQLNGKELSYNNMLDIEIATNLSLEFETSCCVAVKHNTPCGVGMATDSYTSYLECLACDDESIFGGIVAFNQVVDADVAQELSKIFLEVIIAPEFTKEALEIFTKKKNLRVLRLNDYQKDVKEARSCLGGMLVQDKDCNRLEDEMFNIVSGHVETDDLQVLVNLQKVCKYTKSNAIVLGTKTQVVAISGGQTSRVESLRQGMIKVQNKGICEDIYLASDAFFPFADSIELASTIGVKYIIQPGGSIKDDQVISATNELGINMVLTGVRHFKH